jgi:hypothetical protein
MGEKKGKRGGQKRRKKKDEKKGDGPSYLFHSIIGKRGTSERKKPSEKG